MIKYILVFRSPIRLGLHVFESVGPFDTIQQAWDWYNKGVQQWAIPPKGADCITIAQPSIDE